VSNSIIIMNIGYESIHVQAVLYKISVLLPSSPISHRPFAFLLRPYTSSLLSSGFSLLRSLLINL
jgi:hypothetical protein